jgi:hypothetical protein
MLLCGGMWAGQFKNLQQAISRLVVVILLDQFLVSD